MKVALVQCPLWSVTQPPPGLAYVSAALRAAGHEAEIHDLEAELFAEAPPELRPRFAPDTAFQELAGELDLDRRLDRWADRIVATEPDLCGLSVFYSTEETSLALAARIKARNPRIGIVLGGPSCDRNVHGLTFVDDPNVDAVVTGEGEETIVALAAAWNGEGARFTETVGAVVRGSDGGPVDGGDREARRDLDGIAFPDYTGFDLSSYARPYSLPLLTSRGCPNRCKFCSDRGFWRRYRVRSAENVFAEIQRNVDELGVRKFYWVDSLINGKMSELDRLLDRILAGGTKIEWYGFASIRPQMTGEFLAKMKRAGCVLLQYGIESGSAKVRGDMGKAPDVGLVERVVRDTHAAGIRVQGLFIVGYPTETARDFLATLRFIWRNRNSIDYLVRPSFPYVCLPNSILWDEKDDWGIVVDGARYTEWTSQDGKNTYGARKRRLALFHRFVRWIGIPPEIGLDLFSDLAAASEPSPPAQPLAPEDRRARLVSIDGPLAIARAKTGRFSVRLANAGNATFAGWRDSGPHPVGVGYHWLDRAGNVLVFDDGQRAYLDEPLPPGAETTLSIEVTAPNARDACVLRVQVVQDGVAWFDPVESGAHDLSVDVR